MNYFIYISHIQTDVYYNEKNKPQGAEESYLTVFLVKLNVQL